MCHWLVVTMTFSSRLFRLVDLVTVADFHACLTQHNRCRTVLFCRQANCPFYLLFFQVVAGYHKVQVNPGEHGRHGIGPLGLELGVAGGDVLAALFQDTHDINDEQPPTPISSISMGRGPRSWPPWSGGPSSCTVWPVPLVALKLALPVQSTVAFIGVSIGYSGMAGNASTVARNRPSCYKLPGTSVKTLTCREKRGYKKISTARL